MDHWGEGYIAQQDLRLFTMASGFLPPDVLDFYASYSDGTDNYWKVYDPAETDNNYLHITHTSQEDWDTHDGLIYNSDYFQHTILKYHVYFYIGNNYYDLETHTYEFHYPT